MTARRAAVALAVLMTAATAPAEAQAQAQAQADPDPWLAPDKVLHFGLSAGIAGGGYGAAALVWDERWIRLTAGGTLSLGAGAAKELIDLAGAGDPSWRDFAWDVFGCVTGLALALGVDWLISESRPLALFFDLPARR